MGFLSNTSKLASLCMLIGCYSEVTSPTAPFKRISIHPFLKRAAIDNSANFPAFNLNSNDGLRDILLKKGLNASFSLSRLNDPPLSSEAKVEGSDYEIYFGPWKICDSSIRTRQIGGEPALVVGMIPDVKESEPFEESDFPIYEESLETLVKNTDEILEVVDKSRCLYPHERELHAVWRVHYKNLQGIFRAYINHDQILYQEPRFFDVTGRAQIWQTNARDSRLATIELTDLIGDGTLNSPEFTTKVIEGSRAYSANHSFVYNPQDTRFPEVSLFANAQRISSWFAKLGYNPSAFPTIEIIAHDSEVNNARYAPKEGRWPAQLVFGDGDGRRLFNLSTDPDVLFHEFGHHIIYQYVTKTTGEALIIHEALADFFAYSKTGDPCLGESICPNGSSLCAINGQCLRSAANRYVLGSTNIPSEPHLKSQFLSGMLWDIRQAQGVNAEEFTQLTYKSLSFLPDDPSLKDLVVALISADKELYAGLYCRLILSHANHRGIPLSSNEIICLSPPSRNENKLSDPTVDFAEDNAIGDDSPAPPLQSEASQPPKRTSISSGNACGSIGPMPSSHHMAIIIYLLLPLMVMIIRTKKQRQK